VEGLCYALRFVRSALVEYVTKQYEHSSTWRTYVVLWSPLYRLIFKSKPGSLFVRISLYTVNQLALDRLAPVGPCSVHGVSQYGALEQRG
jgi:hypothetical protein